MRTRLAQLSARLPGAAPYDNPRRLFVQKRYEGMTLAQFCTTRHPHLDPPFWRAALDAGRGVQVPDVLTGQEAKLLASGLEGSAHLREAGLAFTWHRAAIVVGFTGMRAVAVFDAVHARHITSNVGTLDAGIAFVR